MNRKKPLLSKLSVKVKKKVEKILKKTIDFKFFFK